MLKIINENILSFKNTWKIVNVFLILLSSSCLFSCSLVPSQKNKLEISTNPQNVEVKFLDDAGVISDLGKTPLLIEKNTLFKNSKSGQLIFEKNGYSSKNLFISHMNEADLNTVRIKLAEENDSMSNLETLNKLITLVSLSQIHIVSKKYDKAIPVLNEAISLFPDLHTLRDLLGNAYYLSGNKSAALETYLKAETISPNNATRKSVIKKLQE